MYCSGLRVAHQATQDHSLLVFDSNDGANLAGGCRGATNRVVGRDVIDLLFDLQTYVIAGVDLRRNTQGEGDVLALNVDASAVRAQSAESTECAKPTKTAQSAEGVGRVESAESAKSTERAKA